MVVDCWNRGKGFYLDYSIYIEYFMIFKSKRESWITNQIVSPLTARNSLFFMPYISELIAKAFHIVNSLRILIGRFRKIHSLPIREIAIIHANHPIEMPILHAMIGTRHSILIISHLLRVHLQPSIYTKLPCVLPRRLTHYFSI